MKRLALAIAGAISLSTMLAPQASACPLFFECYEQAQVSCAMFHPVGSSNYWLCVDNITAACVDLGGGCS